MVRHDAPPLCALRTRGVAPFQAASTLPLPAALQGQDAVARAVDRAADRAIGLAASLLGLAAWAWA